MIEQVSNAITFHAFYTASGEGKTGLTVTIDVYRSTTKVVTTGSATEIGDGLYYYTLASGSVTAEGLYTAVFKTTDVTVDQKHLPALWTVGTAGVEHLDADIGDVPTAAAIADAVLDEDVTAHMALFSLGYYIALISSSFTAVTNSLSVVGNRLGSWTGTGVNTILGAFKALLSKAATMPNDIGGAGDPATDSNEAIAEAVAGISVGGASAADVWAYGTRTLTAVDGTVNIVNPFDTNTARITIGYGEDRSTGSTNGALALTTTTDINLSTAGGTIYFAVREKQRRATEEAVFTLTGSATAALAYTVSLTSATTRLLLPGTYLWTAWHVASGVYTDLGHGDYVVADLVTPTV